MKFRTTCDMGSIKIFNQGLSCFFDNKIGDVPTIVEVVKFTKKDRHCGAKFLGHFTVKDKAYLSAYDCDDDPIYTFNKGRWFVYLLKPAHLRIEKIDNDLHA